MKNFKKVMALAISAAALATSASAFAAVEYKVEGLTGEYTAATNSLDLTVEGASGDKTVLVLADGVSAANATGDDILYINQYAENETAYKSMGLKGETALPVGTYAIKIGYTDGNGDFAIAEGTIKVGEPQHIEVLWGDIDANGEVSGLDASMIVNVVLGGTEDTTYTIGKVVPGTEVLWGDIDTNGEVSGLDASMIVNVVLGGTEDTTYTIGEVVKLPVVAE